MYYQTNNASDFIGSISALKMLILMLNIVGKISLFQALFMLLNVSMAICLQFILH